MSSFEEVATKFFDTHYVRTNPPEELDALGIADLQTTFAHELADDLAANGVSPGSLSDDQVYDFLTIQLGYSDFVAWSVLEDLNFQGGA